MTTPFFRGYDRYDLWTGATVAQAQIWGSPSKAFAALDGVEPGEHFNFPGETRIPPAVLSITPNAVYLGVRGTDEWSQWALNLLGSVQAEVDGIPGRVASYFGNAALVVFSAMSDALIGRLRGKRLVLIGHSLGGAIVQCLVPLLGSFGPSAVACWVYGCPRVGDPTFAAAVSPVVMRVECNDDPIVGVPPPLWAGENSNFPMPGLPPVVPYEHAGDVMTLDPSGSLRDGPNGITPAFVVTDFVNWVAATHPSDIYAERLRIGLNLDPIPPEVGYANGASIVSVYSVLNGSPATKGPSVMPYLTQGIMYFRANNGPVEGWEEAAYFQSDVDTVLSSLKNVLIPSRTACMSNQAEIHAYRAARADGLRRSQTFKPVAPYVGQINLPVNEFGDCIDYQMSDTNASHRIYAFRAVPDSWIEGLKLTPAGIAGTSQLDAFSIALRTAGGGLKIPDPLNALGTFAIIKNDPLAQNVIVITTPGPHGLAQGDLIRITGLRGYPYLRGDWRVVPTDNLNFRLVGSERYNINETTANGGFTVLQYVNSAFTNFSFSGVGFRKTGTPFGRGRGKRSAQIIHH